MQTVSTPKKLKGKVKKPANEAKQYANFFSFLTEGHKSEELRKLIEIKRNLLTIRLKENDFLNNTSPRNLIGALNEIDLPITSYWLKRLTKPSKDFMHPTTGKSYAFKRFTGPRILCKGHKAVFYKLNSFLLATHAMPGWITHLKKGLYFQRVKELHSCQD